ncbi:hypothetical protein UlMin_013075 [Ulmus minor]
MTSEGEENLLVSHLILMKEFLGFDVVLNVEIQAPYALRPFNTQSHSYSHPSFSLHSRLLSSLLSSIFSLQSTPSTRSSSSALVALLTHAKWDWKRLFQNGPPNLVSWESTKLEKALLSHSYRGKTLSPINRMIGYPNWRSRGFGFVSFRNQQDAQSAINDLTGKWLGSRQICCNWATKGIVSNDDKQSTFASLFFFIFLFEYKYKFVVYGKETTNSDAPKNNPQYTTAYVGNLAPELQVTQLDLHRHFHVLGAGVIEEVRVQRDKGFGFMRFSTHVEAALAIQMGNTQLLLYGRQIKFQTYFLPLPAASIPGLSPTDLLAYEQQLAMSKMGGVHALMHPQGQHLKQSSNGYGCCHSATHVLSVICSLSIYLV